MDKNIIERIKLKVKDLPLLPGVYIMKDLYGNIIYVGKAKKLKNRVSQYFINNHKPEKVKQMVEHVYDFDYIIVNSELEALNLEANLIKKNQPFYNILLKDGKAHPFLKINLKQDFPVVELTRKLKKDGAKYFGPFFGSINARDLLDIINCTFGIRNCSLSIKEGKTIKRECLSYFINECLAPCTGKVSKQEYLQEINKVIAFLNGDLKYAKEVLTKKMQICADNLQFERARLYRDYIKQIEKLGEQIITELVKDETIDVFGYSTNGIYADICVISVRNGKVLGATNYSIIETGNAESENIQNFIMQFYLSNNLIPKTIIVNNVENFEELKKWLTLNAEHKVELVMPNKGVKKKLLTMAENNAKEYLEKNLAKEKIAELKTFGAMERLKNILNLTNLPKRIEGFDISNTFGTNKVSSMVVFENGLPKKSHYRKFKIKTVEGINDFASMKETLKRRFEEYKKGEDESFKNLPDLILIDGGMGQLKYAYEAMLNSGVTTNMISLAERFEEIYKPNSNVPVVLERSDYALKLLQNVRDESHRFAITFHKNLRQKQSLFSELKNIPLLGNKKSKELLTHFKSIEKIKNASVEELKSAPNIGDKLANNIYNYFHKN